MARIYRACGLQKGMEVANSEKYAAIKPEDFEAFVGPNVEKFDRARQALADGKPVLGWVWLAFLAPPVWLAYRKLYWWLAGLLIAVIGFSLLLAYLQIDLNFGTGISVAFAMGGRYLVVYRVPAAVAQADLNKLAGEERLAFLRSKGGVSNTAGWIVGVLYLLIIGLFVWSIFQDA